MKSRLLKITLLSLFFGGVSVAGKDVIVAESPVVPVEYINAVPWYIGAGLVWSGAERDCCSDTSAKDTAYGYILRGGYDYNKFIGIEARYIKADRNSIVQVNEHYGLYLKPQYHVTDSINVYGLLGYGKTKFTCSQNQNLNAHTSIDKSGFNWGIGMEIDISSDKSDGTYARGFDGQGDQERSWGLWIDYQNLLHNEGEYNVDANIVTAGITYDF